MTTREQLNQYLVGLERRLRLLVVSKGMAIAVGVALGATLALVLITNALAFSDTSVAVARVVLFVSLAVALGTALVVPLVRLNQRGAAGKAESACPEFEERLLTYVERRENRDPMLDLLAADTMRLAPQASAVRVVPQKSIFTFATSAGAAGAVLLWLILAGPGYMGYGASLLWAGPPKVGPGGSGVYYEIIVEPGNKLVKRRSDIPVTATLKGFQAPLVRLMAKYKSSAKWEEAAMVPRANGTAYEYLLAALPEPVDYYVEAAGVKSKTFTLDVIDLPNIKKIKVTYHYPPWLGQADSIEDPGGDLRAVVGTVAELNIQTDKPLVNGMIEMEDGTKIELQSAGGNMLTAKVPIQKDGVFHFAAKENSESVRLSEDYFIEAKVDEGPSVKITHPGSDTRVSPIEEVSIEIVAEDDFALHSIELHYSVNGSKEKVVPLLATPDVKSADGRTTIALEDFNLVAGDVIAMYATAKDARVETKSDIVFIEAQAFEKNYSQSQAGGGGGGGGGGEQEQNEISKRQKEIITATFNAIRGGPKDRSSSKENAEFLAEVQAKLKAQAESLANRTKARQLAGANQEFQTFTKEMEAAATEMGPASTGLKGLKWQDAYEAENKALQHLRRAEETMRDIQVAFGQQGGGGGGGGNAGRDLANLFDLELDTEKNQYEQGQSAGNSAEQRQKEVDEALEKLQQLARRQQELANQGRNGKQQSIDQRWQQEMLRREAEELKKQMEQMAQQQQNGQKSSSQQGSPSSSSSSSQGGQSGQQSGKSGEQQNAQNRQQPKGASEERLKSALEQLKKATDDMRQAQQQTAQNGGQDSPEARRAAERLNDAASQMAGMRRQDATSQLGSIGDRAKELAQEQHAFEEGLKKAFPEGQDPRAPRGAQPGMTQAQAQAMAAQEDKMLADLKKLEEDMQKSARQMANTQPNASSRLREGISSTQQGDIKRRMEYSSEYIRRGMGGQILQWQPPVTRALDELKDKVQQAQEAMGKGDQQQQGATEAERQLARLEQMRANLERAAGRGQQGKDGKQPGGNQQGQGKDGQGKDGQGKDGQGKDGQGNSQGQGQGQGGNQGGNQNGGGGQFGGNDFGGIRAGGGAYNGGRIGRGVDYGRYNPEGIYNLPDARPVDPSQAVRDAARTLAELRQAYKDDPNVTGQIQDLETEIRKMSFGETASAELQQRLNRTVLPQLETLEVQLRRNMSEQQTGQVRSGGTDKVSPGFAEAVAEYWRKLNKGK